jgi:predicted nucleotide-binding protein
MKPALFVGSSSESLDVAYAVQKNLEDVAEVVVWTQGIFELTKSYLESLLEALEDTEFGVFIFGPDDVIRIRGTEMRAARDNVVFELGLFIGRLGRNRSFILMPKESADFHLPTGALTDRLESSNQRACMTLLTYLS